MHDDRAPPKPINTDCRRHAARATAASVADIDHQREIAQLADAIEMLPR